MNWTDIGVAIALAIGILGIVVPILPGTLLIAAALVLWAFEVQTSAGWIVLGVALTLLLLGQVVKYAVPGRRLKAAGVPGSTLLLATALGFVGFFVVPVIGLFLGFVLGVYLAEARRVGRADAGPATRAALKAVVWSMGIELAAALAAASVWVIGVVAWT